MTESSEYAAYCQRVDGLLSTLLKEPSPTDEQFSQDVWDYLEDLPHMPSRRDRDLLVEAARNDPGKAKRVRIWDYFFRISPEDVGKPIKARIEEVRNETDRIYEEREEIIHNLVHLREEAKFRLNRLLQDTIEPLQHAIDSARDRMLGYAALLWLGVIGAVCAIAIARETDVMPWLLGASFVVGIFALARREAENSAAQAAQKKIDDARERNQQDLQKIEAKHQAAVAQVEENVRRRISLVEDRIAHLEELLRSLIEQIPEPPSDLEVRQWLYDDVAWLGERAKERSGLHEEDRLITLKDAPNPLCFLGPAELQGTDLVPRSFLQDTDRKKHLQARRFALLPDGTFEDFYGVYRVEFILVAADMLATYGGFFDFITGRFTGERISEQYYHDVVAIQVQRVYREISVGEETIAIEDMPVFGLSLASGETREITFASPEYFEGIRQQSREAKVPEFDINRWGRNPELAAENAIRALRARLREHKGTVGDSALR